MRTTFLLCIATLFCFLQRTETDCLTVTCLNPRDTIPGKNAEVRSYFLLESKTDTLSEFDIRSSCGCEYPVWKKDMRIYPGHPDTVIIVSSLNNHSGHWKKQTTISTDKCTVSFYTGPWIILE